MSFVLIQSLLILLQIIEYIVFARVLLSWFPIPQDNKLIQIIFQLTEPLLAPVREVINRVTKGRMQMIDFSPLVLILLIMLISSLLRNMYFN